MEKKNALDGILFISPWLMGFVLFFAFPFFKSLLMSFSKITNPVGFKTVWTGLDNYVNAFVVDIDFIPMFLSTIKETLINTPLILVFSLFIAMVLNQKIKLRGLFRGIFFLPVLLGTGYVMRQLLGMNVDDETMEMARGILLPQEALYYLGPSVVAFVQEFLSRITIVLWKSGVQIVLFLAGLQSIPVSLYESSNCDGATEWEKFWKITLPMISPVMLLNAVYTLIESFTDASNPIVDYIIGLGFKKMEFAYSAAVGWIFFLFIFLLILILFAIAKIVNTVPDQR